MIDNRCPSFSSMSAQVINFPTPAPYPTLQPSVHARGARPYHFIHALDSWHAPGIQKSGQGCCCAVDAAWIVEGLRGPPTRPPAHWPGMEHVRKKAYEFGESVGLYDYQKEGAAFLGERDYAVLSDAMGCGKTPQALIAAEARLSYATVPDDATPVVLVVCPALAKRHWSREIKRWTGHDAVVLEGLRPFENVVSDAVAAAIPSPPKSDDTPIAFDEEAQRVFLFEVRKVFPRLQLPDPTTFDENVSRLTLTKAVGVGMLHAGYSPGVIPLPKARYLIANYDIIRTARRRTGAGKLEVNAELPGWGGALQNRFLIGIIDEGHELRGRKSQRQAAIKKMLQRVPVVWSLTGTPVPNYVRDLWGLVDVTSDGIWGRSYWDWARKYCSAREGKYGWEDTGSDNLEELQRRLSFFMLGRSKEAVKLQLPEKRREIYEVDVDVTAPTVQEAHQSKQKFRQVAKALRATARAKRPAVIAQALEALRGGQKIIVYTYLREQAEAIAAGIRKDVECQVFCVHGDQSPDQRDVVAGTFRGTAGAAAFVATMDSVGVAISLVGADLVLYADLSHEPHKILQPEARAHRHGSEKRVLVRFLIAKGTIDEAIAEAVLSKLKVMEEALGSEEEGGGLSAMLAPDPKEAEAVVDRLFDKLRAWGKKG